MIKGHIRAGWQRIKFVLKYALKSLNAQLNRIKYRFSLQYRKQRAIDKLFATKKQY